jgi:hypothetical protein
MEKIRKILITIWGILGKTIGAGLATIGLAGAGIGVFIVLIYLFYRKRFLVHCIQSDRKLHGFCHGKTGSGSC